MAARKRSSVTPCAVVARLTAGPPPRILSRRRVGSRLAARLWRRRLSLFGLLLLALGASWIAHGSVTSGGWESAVLQALVWLEIAFMGVLLLCMDLGELVPRVLRRQAAEPERVGERRAKTPWRAGQR